MTPYERKLIADECLEEFRSVVIPAIKTWGTKYKDFLHLNEDDVPGSIRSKFNKVYEEFSSMISILEGE